MRIIKQGIPPSERLYVRTCYTCKTEFEFKQSEAKLEMDVRDGNYLRINCPVCGNMITCDPKCAHAEV